MPTKKKRQIITDTQLPPAIDKEDVCPAIYTGQKLADRDPVKYGQIVQSLASGMPVTRIARTFKVAPETVSAVMMREKDSIEAVEGMTKQLTTYASQTALVKLVEALENNEVPATQLAIVAGIMRDHSRKDAGMATHTIEVKKTLSLQDVKRELEQMKADAIEVEIEDL
jgi:hypothetical protein